VFLFIGDTGMRILDIENNKVSKNITLYLKLEEARKLADDLHRLIDNYGNNEHTHINDCDYTHEITVVLYNENNIIDFNERSRKLIIADI
jgi:hypothetical protein